MTAKKQNDVFRFVSQRAVQLASDSDLKRKVILAYDPDAPPDGDLAPVGSTQALVTRSQSLAVPAGFLSRLTDVATPIAALDKWLGDRGNRPTPDSVANKTEELTGKRPKDLVQTPGYKADRNQVASSLAALTLDPQNMERLRNQLLRAMYIFGLIERLAMEPPQLITPDDVYKLLVDGLVILEPGFPAPAEALARMPAIADLKVVRQELLRYEMGELAHIENVLKGESKERVHRRANTLEEITTVETERTEESEQDLQSAERFEMQKEVSATISEDTNLEAGLTVTASYGPTLSVTADVGYAANYSKEESSRVATSYARDVTQRSSTRIQERVRAVRTTRTVTEVEETNKHTVNNTTANEHIIGIYRWVDKVYKAQVFNYGKRLILEFMVPEPAALVKHAMNQQTAAAITMKEPEAPVAPGSDPPRPLSPADITESNYLTLVEKHRATGASAPPVQEQTVSLAWDEPYPGPNTPVDPNTPAFLRHKAKKEIKIPNGYRAGAFKATILAEAWKSDVLLSVGNVVKVGSKLPGQQGGAALPLEISSADEDKFDGTGELPVTLRIWNTWGYSASIVVTCDRQAETFAKWQLATYEAIMRGYAELKSQYDEQVTAAQTQRGIAIDGRTSLESRGIERNELKRNIIAMLERQHFNQPPVDQDAIQVGNPEKYPEVNFTVARAERDFIQWFEQAFEWPQMTYNFYPYYWGRKAGWIEDVQGNGGDPLFSAFLKAGAARVVVPVRPGFERAMALYLATGIIWNGTQVPQVGDPLYLSIVHELQEQQQGDPQGTPEGASWEFRVPTSLVMLQKDANLPTDAGLPTQDGSTTGE